ncbi:nuclear transport factor 2 family protein [Mycobacterium yunnanensis]|uniref:Nuclear transport factor 2 family protein n=1 Tax=Mycobacterium yunnanensis TaxID=368477 RepID=A0A9X2Z9G3_9MYCO|nr:nuclear transport factor 2 family protein [Mycobacterium yunnanensis]MCV7424166.1 nuclear transport factor 2 family protein [Mycobacterium yunnanensis]
MSEEQDHVELIKKGYDAFAAGDVERLMSMLDDNVEWVQPGESTISGTYHGKGELGGLLARMAEKSATVTPTRFVADGDTVVAIGDVSLDGETSQGANVFTIRDGKVAHVRVYGDTAMLERLFGKKQVSSI